MRKYYKEKQKEYYLKNRGNILEKQKLRLQEPETLIKRREYLKCRARGVTSLKNFHSNDGEIADYSKIDVNSVPDSFDYKSVQLEKAAKDQEVDLDALLNLKRTEGLRTKAIWRNTN